jgi:hypothetical protein
MRVPDAVQREAVHRSQALRAARARDTHLKQNFAALLATIR